MASTTGSDQADDDRAGRAPRRLADVAHPLLAGEQIRALAADKLPRIEALIARAQARVTAPGWQPARVPGAP